MIYALIKANRCVNRCESTPETLAKLLLDGVIDGYSDDPTILIGFVFNGSSWGQDTESRPSIRRKAFFRRFTAQEREALENIRTTGTQAQKNKLNAFLNYLLMDEFVDLGDAYIIASVQLMETASVIAPGRANEILSG